MIPFEGSGTPVLKLSELSNSWKHYLSHEKVQQVQIEVDLRIADRLIQSGNATTYYADLRQSFLEGYKKENIFNFQLWALTQRRGVCKVDPALNVKCTFEVLVSASEKF